MQQICPSASVSPDSYIASGVEIGEFCVIEAGVRIGAGCRLLSHVVVKSGTILGENNTIHEGAIIGGTPLIQGRTTGFGRLEIGSRNTIRELVTIQTAAEEGQSTRIGDDTFIMPSSQIGHDSQIGNHVILTNYSCLSGHVVVEDRAVLGGQVSVHQFCRIGAFAMVGMSAYVARDVPPYVTIDGRSGQVVGLNTVGLKRNGFSTEEITELKHAYRIIYREGLLWNTVLEKLRDGCSDGPAARFYEFLSKSKRGLARERRCREQRQSLRPELKCSAPPSAA